MGGEKIQIRYEKAVLLFLLAHPLVLIVEIIYISGTYIASLSAYDESLKGVPA